MAVNGRTRQINLSGIPEAKRAKAWARLQRKHPALAAWCVDPCVQALKTAFDADLIIEVPVIP